jgi:hypothetical protein
MSTVAPTATAPLPLGLPRGTIRGFLSLTIMAMFWILLFLPDDKKVQIPLNLYFMMGLVLLFFVAHSQPEERQPRPDLAPYPFYITLIRLFIVGGTIAVLVFQFVNHQERLMERLTPTPQQVKDGWATYLLATILGFTLGYAFKILPGKDNWIVQSFSAWVSILAMISMVVELMIQAFITPDLEKQVDLKAWQTIVTGLVAFYFGSRT